MVLFFLLLIRFWVFGKPFRWQVMELGDELGDRRDVFFIFVSQDSLGS